MPHAEYCHHSIVVDIKLCVFKFTSEIYKHTIKALVQLLPFEMWMLHFVF